MRKVQDKGDIMLVEGVVDQEGGEVGTREDDDLTASAVKVGSDGILEMTFVPSNEDEAKCGRASSRRDAEDNVQ